MNDTKQTVLITGGAGYIGTAMVDSLLKNGYQVVAYDNLSTGQKDKVHEDAVFIEGDVLDEAALDTVFSDHTIDVVVHCAGKKVATESEVDPTLYLRTNLVGTLNVLDCMSRHNVPKILFSSTCGVYGDAAGDRPATENDDTTPVSVYGHSKLMAERLIKEYTRLSKIQSYIIFRYFQVAGDVGLRYQDPDSAFVFNVIVKALKNKGTFYVTGTDYPTRDGSGVRDYIHLDDLADAHLRALSYDSSDVFNLGTNNGYTVRELINTFEEVSGMPLIVEEAPRRPGDIVISLADCSHAKEKLGWEAKQSLRDMVASTLDTYLKD